MADDPYATPILIGAAGASRLARLPLGGGGDYDELFIQELVFEHPETLPVAEIDRAYEGLIPVCTELNTQAGPLDVLYVTPKGRLVVVEAKLWRNPEARRKVVGQILDYAKELSRWDYEDLQREVSRATKRTGNVLYELVRQRDPTLEEARFVDEVSRSLREGHFLLLVVGDGIREGVAAIADFMERSGHLAFTFGLVELGLYKADGLGTLVQPRVLAKTVVIKRTVVTFRDGRLETQDDESMDEVEQSAMVGTPPSDLERFYMKFWPEFLGSLELDDKSQPVPKPTERKIANAFFPMPPGGGGQAWVTMYFSQRYRRVGVFLTFLRGALADDLYQKLLRQQEDINAQLGIDAHWEANDGKYAIGSFKHFPDLLDPANQEEIKLFLSDAINRYVNVFRPRLEKLAEEL
ncbi:hypothetical protein [Frateuria soli]|uniref:hypothetical protein n=1 Tax=Frateuria soli TaxID=1542730 RepID=UPI001E4F08CA|nr:hypothetical protein [Frateuria soli]UGB36869.1 hypothetical protein LQ771_08420 [Frateuria soli]